MIAICASQSAKSFHAKMFYVRFSYKNYFIHFSHFCNTVFFTNGWTQIFQKKTVLNHLKEDLPVAPDDGIDSIEDLLAGLGVNVDAVAVAGVVHQGHLSSNLKFIYDTRIFVFGMLQKLKKTSFLKFNKMQWQLSYWSKIRKSCFFIF